VSIKTGRKKEKEIIIHITKRLFINAILTFGCGLHSTSGKKMSIYN
jgi:hypothetical protein